MKRIILCIAMLGFIGSFIFIRVLSSFPLEENFSYYGTLAGKVTNEDGKPIQGATIRILGTTKGAISKADGSFLIAGILAGEYDVKVTSVGYQEFIQNLRISVDQTTTLNATLTTKTIQTKTVAVSARRQIVPERNGSVRSRSFDDPGSGARTNVQSAVVRSSGVTSGGVNGFSIRGGRATETSIRVGGDEVSDPFQGGFGGGEGANSESEPAAIPENEFVPTMRERTSTFGIDVDNASYSMMRQQVAEGALPNPATVRIEEMINYFDYDYPEPTGDDPFSIITEVSSCPWNPEHRLVHIGLQGRHVDISAVPPGNLVFLIDVSGSMASPEKLPLLIDGFKLMVKELRPEDNVAIVVYAGAAGVVLPSTPGSQKEKIIAALDKLQAGGSTAGGAGIQLAYDIAKQGFKPEGNNRVILATDGDFNVGISSDDALVKLIEAKRKEKIFLTVLGFGMGYSGDRKMEKLADNGNGSYAYIDNLPEARRVLVNELSGTLYTIAKDVKLQVEFNPVTVAGYRLIGYENRVLANEDFANDLKDAGDLGAGHSVTALYEVIPNDRTKEDAPQLSDARPADASMRYGLHAINTEAYMTSELMDIRLRYKLPQDSASKLVEHPLTDRIADIATVSENFRFAAAVAELGLLLRGSRYKGSASYDATLTLARGALGTDRDGYRKELVEIGEKCRAMAEK